MLVIGCLRTIQISIARLKCNHHFCISLKIGIKIKDKVRSFVIELMDRPISWKIKGQGSWCRQTFQLVKLEEWLDRPKK